MTAVPCEHCGQPHSPGTAFCPNTGRPQHVAPGAAELPRYNQTHLPARRQPTLIGHSLPAHEQPAPPAEPKPDEPKAANPHEPVGEYRAAAMAPLPGEQGKPVTLILREAWELYQKNLATLLLTCAILVVPVSIAKSAAIALMLAPTVAVSVATHSAAQLTQTAAKWHRQIQEAQLDPLKLQQVQQQQQRELKDLSRNLAMTETAAVSGFMAWLLGFFAMLVGFAMMYGIAIPLVTGALTIVVADRATGGNAGPGEAYRLLLRRLGKFLSAWIPAFVLVLVGLCFLVVPGLVVGFLFVFVVPVVLLENVGGIAALHRSIALVKANMLQVALMSLVFAGIRIIASLMTALLVPKTAFFVGSLVEDVALMFLLPLPIIGTVLLYLDIRRQADGLDDVELLAGIDGLRRA